MSTKLINMEILSFNSISVAEERKSYQNAFNNILNDLFICIYNKQTQSFTEKICFREAFEHNDINEGVLKGYSLEKQIEAVLTLGHAFFKYVRINENRIISDDFEKYALLYRFRNQPESELIEKLGGVETFLKEIAFLLYPDKKSSIENIQGEKSLSESGNLNLVKRNNALFCSIDEVLRGYRNKNFHGVPSSPYYIPKDNDENGYEIRQKAQHLMASFIILVLLYKYDALYEALEKEGAFNSEKVAIKGAEFLEKYVEDLNFKQIEYINKDIYKIDDSSNLEQIIDIRLKRFESNEEEDDGSEDNYINADDLLENKEDHFILLGGESGSGKTTMLAYMIYKSISAWKKDKENNPIPIKIELRKIKSEGQQNIYENFFDYVVMNVANTKGIGTNDQSIGENDIRSLNAIRTYLRNIFSKGNCILFIEGLNEIVQKDKDGNNISLVLRKRVIQDIEEFSLNNNKVRYFVTTRISGIMTNEQGSIDHFLRYDLQPLDDVQILTQINNYNNIVSTGNKSKQAFSSDLWNKIKDHKIGELAQNPMQLMQIVELFGNRGIEKEEYDIKLSELFRKLIEERLLKKANFLLPEVKDEKSLIFLVNNLLRFCAKEQFEKQCRSTDYDNILNHSKDIITIPTNSTIDDILKVATSLFILKDEYGTYSFNHDSWQTYYLAYDLAVQVKECKDNDEQLETVISNFVNAPEDLQKQDMMDVLRETFEILEYEWMFGRRKTRDGDIKNIRENATKNNLKSYSFYDTDDLETLQKNLQAETNNKIRERLLRYAKETNDVRRRMSRFAQKLLSYGDGCSRINPLLPVLAYAVATLQDEPCNNDVNSPGDNQQYIQPKEIIRQQVSNLLKDYEIVNIHGLNADDAKAKVQIIDFLKPIFTCIALINDESLLDIIFSPYWIRLWIMKAEDEKKVFGQNNSKNDSVNTLPGVLIEKNNGLLLLYKKLYEIYKSLVIMNLSSTAKQAEYYMMRILLKLRDGDIIKVIDTLLEKDEDPIEQIINRRLCANALLVLNNVDVMFEKLDNINKSMQKEDANFEYRFKSGIHLRAASKLMGKFDNPKIQELIIGKEWRKEGELIGLLEDLPIGSDVHLKILSSVLIRYNMVESSRQKKLWKYLESEDGQFVIRNNPWLLDLLPYEKVPHIYAQYYDKEVMNFINQDNGPYYIDKVYYHEVIYQDRLYASFPRPLNYKDINQLYVRFDASGVCDVVEIVELPEEVQKKYSNRPLMFIKKTGQYKRGDGFLNFYLEENGTYSKPIGYDSFKDVVRINHPELYHSSICKKLVDSCKSSADFKDIYLFCKKKSGVKYIVNKFLDNQFKEWEFPLPNVCVVLDSFSAQTHLFSPSKSGILDKFVPKRYKTGSFFINYALMPHGERPDTDNNTFVVCEISGKVGFLDFEKFKAMRSPVLGFVNGTIVQHKHQLAISVSDEYNYVFYIDDKTNKNKTFHKGDLVSFFPSITYLDNVLTSVALYVEIIK